MQKQIQNSLQLQNLTSLWSAEAAVPRIAGSIESRRSTRANAEEGKSLNVSLTQRG